VLLRLAYLAATNTFALLRLLPMGDRDKDIENPGAAAPTDSSYSARSASPRSPTPTAPSSRACSIKSRLTRHSVISSFSFPRPLAIPGNLDHPWGWRVGFSILGV
jgi:hypothetical protein